MYDFVQKVVAYKARQQRIYGKGTTLALIIGGEDYEDIFDGDDQCQGPDDQGDDAEQIFIRRFRGED